MKELPNRKNCQFPSSYFQCVQKYVDSLSSIPQPCLLVCIVRWYELNQAIASSMQSFPCDYFTHSLFLQHSIYLPIDSIVIISSSSLQKCLWSQILVALHRQLELSYVEPSKEFQTLCPWSHYKHWKLIASTAARNISSFEIRRRKRFDIHLLTKMSDMTRRFEVIMTSFSSDKRNGQVQV